LSLQHFHDGVPVGPAHWFWFSPLTKAFLEYEDRGMSEPLNISRPEFELIAATRVALGAGAALLLGSRLSANQRKAVGWTLLAVGAVTSVPIFMRVYDSGMSFDRNKRRRSDVTFVEEEFFQIG
jgi:hypothetical protein